MLFITTIAMSMQNDLEYRCTRSQMMRIVEQLAIDAPVIGQGQSSDGRNARFLY